MPGFWITRKLQRNAAQLKAAREELDISDEQWLHIPDTDPEADAMNRHRAVLRDRIARLEAEQDQLLDRVRPAE